jgi:hypothetical protein
VEVMETDGGNPFIPGGWFEILMAGRGIFWINYGQYDETGRLVA